MSPNKRNVKVNLNNFMHPRNIYLHNPPDFSQLAMENLEFRSVCETQLNGKINVDFNHPLAMKALTKALLKSDFDLDVEIPDGYLVPAVPQRLNYVLWCEDIVAESIQKKSDVKAIDFGSGASCILALLGVRQCAWSFICVEPNTGAYNTAVRNISVNGLEDMIRIMKTTEGEVKFSDFIKNESDHYDIFMCNPPFYADSWEADAVAKAESEGRSLPVGDNDGLDHEKITVGGELEFVKRIYEQSVLYKDNIAVYTAMLGKKKDLKELTKFFKENSVNFCDTEFCQGKTMRWGIAWTFRDDINLNKVPQMKHVTPKPPLEYQIPKFIPGVKYTTETVFTRCKELIANVQMRFSVVREGKHHCQLMILAEKNTLSGQRRKRRQKLMKVAGVVPDVGEVLHKEAVKIKGEEKMELDEERHEQGEMVKSSAKRGRSSDEEEDDEVEESMSVSSPMSSGSSKSVTKKVFANTSSEDLSNYFLNCDLRVRRTSAGLVLQIQNRDHMSSRDGICQLMQYMKNNLCSDPKELALTLKMVV